MSKSICPICQNNGIGLLNPKVQIKDGKICLSCWKDAGYGTSLNEYMKGREMVIADFQTNSQKLVGDTAYEKLSNLIIDKPTLSLKGEEVCFYQGKAKSYHSKTIVTGYSGGSSGFSIRVAKGLSVRNGSSKGKAIRETIGQTFDGTLYITNMRIVLLTSKYGFDIPITKISQIEPLTDGFQLFHGSKSHLFQTKDVDRIAEIINLMNEGFNEQSKTNSKSNKNISPADEIKKFKELLDADAISQEEFDAKKKQLLGL